MSKTRKKGLKMCICKDLFSLTSFDIPLGAYKSSLFFHIYNFALNEIFRIEENYCGKLNLVLFLVCFLVRFSYISVVYRGQKYEAYLTVLWISKYLQGYIPSTDKCQKILPFKYSFTLAEVTFQFEL